jgi:hypothetical protein
MSPSHKLSEEFMAKLGLANLYGWLAYTIYDDFLDGEGKPELISTANVSMRRSLENFVGALPENESFAAFVHHTFDAIDGANAWEVARCRFKLGSAKLQTGRLPDYGNLEKLADRSLGHALAPMAVLAAAGQGLDTDEAQKMFRAFRHYLIARQLNDDAHDWEEDLRAGLVTPAVVMVLKKIGVRPGKRDITELISTGRHHFWHVVLPEICELMRSHVRLSREALRSSALVKKDGIMDELLDGIEASASSALNQQKQAEDFLKYYRQSTKKHKN